MLVYVISALKVDSSSKNLLGIQPPLRGAMLMSRSQQALWVEGRFRPSLSLADKFTSRWFFEASSLKTKELQVSSQWAVDSPCS